jgi:methyl-accepting chemotaxis protein
VGVVWPESVATRRRLGRGLVAFGAIGLALILATGVLAIVTLGSIGDAATGLERQRTELVQMLDPAATSIRDAATSATHAGASLTESAKAAQDGASLTTQLAASMEQLNSLSNLDILGQRPFAGIGSSFGDLAVRSRTLSASLTTTADALSADITDTAAVGRDLNRLAGQLDELRASAGASGPSAASTGFAWLPILVLALLLWLAVPAAGSLWLGLRLLRRRPEGP